MKFRDWLFLEDDGDSADGASHGGGGAFWDILYPTTAADYMWAAKHPVDHFFYQWRLRRGIEVGRPLHNIDNKEFQQRTYTSIESKSAPDGGEGFWNHQEDTGDSSTKVVKNLDLVWIGDGEDSKSAKPIKGYHFCNTPFGACTTWDDYSNDPEAKLRQTFGDEASGDWPNVPDNFDEPWTKKYEAYMAEFATAMHGGIQDLPGSKINNMPGIKSRISATDNVKEEPSMEKSPDKLFGFKKWLDKKRAKESGQRDIHKKRQGAPLRVPQVYT